MFFSFLVPRVARDAICERGRVEVAEDERIEGMLKNNAGVVSRRVRRAGCS